MNRPFGGQEIHISDSPEVVNEIVSRSCDAADSREGAGVCGRDPCPNHGRYGADVDGIGRGHGHAIYYWGRP